MRMAAAGSPGLRKKGGMGRPYAVISTVSRSRSVRRDESRKPFANGLLSIFSFVICTR